MTKLEFVFHSDAGHGWLEVPIQMLMKFGIADKVSSYSYMRGDLAYLEEDCDAGLLLKALDESGIEFKFFEVYDGDDSPIRNFKRYGGV
jgi:hypothetical protein